MNEHDDTLSAKRHGRLKQALAMGFAVSLVGTLALSSAQADFFVGAAAPATQTLTTGDYQDSEIAYLGVSYEELEAAALAAGTIAAAGSFEVAEGDHAAVLASIPNGSMPDHLLASLSFTSWKIYVGAAPALEAMNAAYRADTGQDLSINNIYRPGYQGKSLHGWGLAIDFNGAAGIQNWGDSQYQWLVANGPSFGFYHPFWAGQGGMNPEAWHWEFGSYYGLGAGDCASRCPDNRQLWVKG